jgi:predicted PurR-regulated permease PerM
MDNPKEVNVTITPRTIINIVLTLLGLWVAYQIRDVLTLIFIVIGLVIAFSSIIKSWEKYLPRTLSIVVLYTILILVFIITAALIVPILVSQLTDFLGFVQTELLTRGISGDNVIQQFHDNLEMALHGEGIQGFEQLFIQFRGSLGAVYSTTVGFLGGIVAIFTVLISSFYLLLDEENFQKFIRMLFPKSEQNRASMIMDHISAKMGNYLRGQLLLMLSIGVVIGIALAILGVPYPLLLGIWAGLMELFPYVGPVLGAVPGVFLAFTTLGMVKGLIALVIYLIVQQLENQFLAPKIMGKALGLSPVVIIFALLIGGKLFGLVGLLIAVPVAGAISVFYQEWRNGRT